MEISARNLNEDQKKSMKVDNIKTEDHISELPEDILASILSFLTMGDAVRASVLSSRWRYLFAVASNLHFDLLTIFGIKYKLADLWERRFRFITAVDQVLQQYRCSKTLSFKLRYCLGNESACHIDEWISFAVLMKTEVLDLNLSYIPDDCEPYNFSYHLLRNASHLKHLILESCVLRSSHEITSCLSLNSLQAIDLTSVCLDQSVLNNILSDCINLEFLRLKRCRLPVNLSVHKPFPCLKLLALKSCFGADRIEISSINLITFKYIGWIEKLSFDGVSSVEKVNLKCLEYIGRTRYYGPAKDLPKMQSLSLVLSSSQVRRMPVKKNTLGHLKELELIIGLVTNIDLLIFTSILSECPNLQKFLLHLRRLSSFEGELVRRGYSKPLYDQLKEVEIGGFVDVRSNSLELVIYLLHKAVGLERMTVNLQNVYECRSRDEEKKLVHHVLSNERVNPNVELIVL